MISFTISNVDSSTETQQRSGVSTDKNSERRLNFAIALVVIVIFSVGVIQIYTLFKSFPAYHAEVEVASNKTTTDKPESQSDKTKATASLPCDTEQCEGNLTESIRRGMNSGVDPCEDFYQFACGYWKSSSGANSQFIQVRERTLWKLMDLTEQINETDTEAMRQLKVIYDSCVNFSYKVDKVQTNSSSWELENPMEWFALKWKLGRTIALSSSPATLSRRRACVKVLEEELMPLATAHKYILGTVKNETVDDAKEMYNNVVTSLHNLISSLDWMDKATKELAIRNLMSLKVQIGYPDWVQDPQAIEECYQGLNFTNGTFLENELTLKTWERESKLYDDRECLLNPVRTIYGWFVAE